MRDFLDAHVSQADEFGTPVDVDDVFITAVVRGSYRIKYARNIDKVCVEIASWRGNGSTSMQLTLDQAILLRDLLDAGIADAIVAKSAMVLELPSGGAA